MPEQKKLYFKLFLYAIAFLITVILVVNFLVRAKNCREDLDHLKTAEKISENMPITFIVKHFEIPEEVVFAEINLPINHWNKRYTLLQACQKNHLNCSLVVENLNQKISQ